jgi:Pyruvate/2-oxoacid:ferredoxin oxidoreductase delta subunit
MSVLTYHTWSGNEAIMQPFLLNELKILGFDAKTDSVGNIYAVRGKAEKYPLLNAHMDIIYSLSTKAKTKIQAQMKKDKPVEPEYSYKDIIQCANCSFLEACIDLVMKEANIKEQQAYWRLKWSKGCGMYIFDNEGYNKMLYALYDKEYDPTKKPTFGYYSDCSYSYISEKEKPDYDKYLNEMYQIKFDDKSGKITGDESRVLGGDDKCGIALALATARALPELPMKLLFTVGEEKGCIGAKEFCDKNKKWFADCKYSITIHLV